MDAALHLLKFRGRSEAEMSRRLAMKKFPPDVVRHTVRRLKELSLLDDDKLAREWVISSRVAGQGERRIRQTLWKRGIPRLLIDHLLHEADGVTEGMRDGGMERNGEKRIVTESDRATNALGRKLRQFKNREFPRQVLYRRLSGYLNRQGFSPDVIRDVLESHFKEPDL
jgi:SOS response regulatory protein OraA/RecX